MFLKPPKSKECGIELSDSIRTWEEVYQCMFDDRVYPVVVKVDHIYPSCEVLGMRFCADECFADIRIADYTKHMISQQAMADFINFAEKTSAALKRTAKLDDPFFEVPNEPAAIARAVPPSTKPARRKVATRTSRQPRRRRNPAVDHEACGDDD